MQTGAPYGSRLAARAGWTAVLLLLGPGGGLVVPWAGAQPAPDTTTIEMDLEEALEEGDEASGDAAQLAEWLPALAAHPLDLNTATAEALAQIPALSPLAARRIVRFRSRSGPFASVSDLTRVPGLDEETCRRALPYLTALPPPRADTAAGGEERTGFRPRMRALKFEAIQRTTRRLERGRGYLGDSTRTYLGSPERIYTRLRASYGRRASLNLTLEKDPGEPFAWHPATRTYLFDHVSAHAAVRDLGRIETLVVGDFTASYGQGLVLWRSSAFGKGRDPVRPLARFGVGIQPYASTEENRFFRGAAVALRITPALSVSAFGSRRRLDAALLTPDTTEAPAPDPYATSLAESGLHRYGPELDRKDALGEQVFGGSIAFSRQRFTVGLVGYHSRFDQAFQAPAVPYQRFRFAGTEATMAGAYGHLFLGDILLFGEAARAPGGPLGGVGGVQMQLGGRGEAVVAARSYPADFVSLHGYAFGERSGATQNEAGFYTGLRLRLADAWTLAAYFDQFRFPWLRYGVPRPSTGSDALLLVTYAPRRWLSLYVQGRTETKEAGFEVPGARGLPLGAVRPETRQSVRLHGDYHFSRTFRLRARAELVRTFFRPAAAEQGLILYQDIRWAPSRRLQVDFRLAFFDTDSYAARVYAYENDLRYTFSVPALSGRGQRSYLLVRYAPARRLDLQVKYAVTRFEDVRTVGSGLDQAAGGRLRELRAQLRWRLGS